MIVQQVNLYQDRFREKRLLVSAQQLAVSLLVLLAVVAGLSYLLQSEWQQAQQRNLALKAEREQLSAELAVVNAELTRLLGDSRLDQEIETTAKQVSARKRVLHFVDANRFGSGDGFSNYLVALSELHIDDIWLNQIRLGQDFVHIKGSSLRADQVPAYVDRFSEKQVFEGNRFDLFELSRVSGSDWKVDFEIATSGEMQ